MVILFRTGLRLSLDVNASVSCRLLGSFFVEERVVWGSLVESSVRSICTVETDPVSDRAFGLEAIVLFT